jgi:uncharacterized protein YcbX
MTTQHIGHVLSLWRYPVKSMRGEPLTDAQVWWHGLEGDRRYAFVRTDSRSSFPWLTGREVPSLLTYRPTFDILEQPVTSPITIATPGGSQLALEDQRLKAELERHAGEPLHLLHLGRNASDSGGISLISTNTLSTFDTHLAEPSGPLRFRANLLIQTDSCDPYPEDHWLGSSVQFGTRPDAVRIRVLRPIKRCVMINLDPETAAQNPAVLRTVVQQHSQHAGVYGATEQTGVIMVGDPVLLV